MPISCLPLSDWLGSSISPPLITRSNLSSGPMTAWAGLANAVVAAAEAAATRNSRPARRRFAHGGEFRGVFDCLLECRQCRLDRVLRHVAGDEHHAGAAVLARPLRQQHRWVKEVLHAV